MYSPEQLDEIFEEKIVVASKSRKLLEEYLLLSPALSPKVQEHCQYGICRRLFIINECLEYFFSEMAPHISTERSHWEQSRADIYLHAFLINVSGIINNMVWLWAYHIDLQDRFDLEKKKPMIDLSHKDFSEYLPDKLNTLVCQYSKWHEFMVNHRHPTAHRIPPYVIRYTNSEDNDPPESRNYLPRYIHSFSSQYGPVPLHEQSLFARTIASRHQHYSGSSPW
jgi:hypothetical protein